MSTKRQRELPFDGKREADRQERVKRLLSKPPGGVTTGARHFTELEFRKATELARAAVERSNGR